MLKISFIFPSSDYLIDPFRGDPFTHFHILTILEEHFGNQVELSLIDLRGIKRNSAIYHISEADIFLHSVYTLDISEQSSLITELRQHYPKALHIAGGPHANVFQEGCLKIFDAVILGEGEESIKDVVNDVLSNNLKKIYHRPEPIDINRYPFWQRKYLPKSATARKNMMTLKNKPGSEEVIGTTAIFSRGCPYKCHFCALAHERKANPGIRHRSTNHIVSEIEYLKSEYGIRGLALSDEIGIPLNHKSAISYLEAIAQASIIWRGQCRIDGITEDLARLASQSGCVALGFGLESVSQQSLEIINKKINVQDAYKTLEWVKNNGIETRIYLIMGLPGEPLDIVDRTWSFIQRTQPDIVHLSIFTVRPGTEVFSNPKKFGIKQIYTDWDLTSHNHGRHKERPRLTFEYEEITPWGKSLTEEEIVNNYIELDQKLKENGLRSVDLTKQIPQD